MSRIPVAVWKNAPFIRLLLPLVAGIILQWYVGLPAAGLLKAFVPSCLWILVYSMMGTGFKFRWRYMMAAGVQLLLVTAGMLLLHYNNITSSKQWLGALIKPGDKLAVRLLTNPVEKPNSFKCIAVAEYLVRDTDGVKQHIGVTGKLYLYIEKRMVDDTGCTASVKGQPPGAGNLHENDRMMLLKIPELVKPSGNPYSFNYQRYSLFQGITHQLYVRQRDIRELPPRRPGARRSFFMKLQTGVLKTIRLYVHGAREAGLAEALLIGYKEDLDPELVTAYTNTGLAHVIAISGMHLALVYWILMVLLRPLGKKKGIAWLSPVLTITGLWIFTILAGAQPSVLRSAVMFTCIIAGRAVSRNNSIYNSLFASAFILLCFNPFWLWDLGFQLSYAAVLSLLVFNKPVYHWIFFSNRAIDLLWKSVSVSLSAQVLTIPISIFYFHQFPNYFIISNLVAVPVSTAVLFGEIILCAVAIIPAAATIAGDCISWLIRTLNTVIDYMAALPFATMEGLQIGILQVIMLYAIILCIWRWLARPSPSPSFFMRALFFTAAFITMRSLSFINSKTGSYLIIYNVPKKSSMEWVAGRKYIYSGDSLSLREFDFHLKPFHLKQRLSLEKPNLFLMKKAAVDEGRFLKPGTQQQPVIFPGGERIVFMGDRLRAKPPPGAIPADLVVVSRKSLAGLSNLLAGLHPVQVVLDSSVPDYMAGSAARLCDSMGIRCHVVSVSGAFVFPLH